MDPTAEEEAIASSSFSVVINNKGGLVSFLKHGGSSVTETQLEELLELAKTKTKEMLPLLKA